MTSLSDLSQSGAGQHSSESSGEKLDRLMSQMAENGFKGMLDFWMEFSAKMCRSVKGILRELGRKELTVESDFVKVLAFECCWVVLQQAPKWRSNYEPPWLRDRPLLTLRIMEILAEMEGEEDMAEYWPESLPDYEPEYEPISAGRDPWDDRPQDLTQDVTQDLAQDMARGQDMARDMTTASPEPKNLESENPESEKKNLGEWFDEAVGLKSPENH